ncbi:tetratricopeptide repeat protein [Streptacidiphilus sp. PAMC 29251]
MPVAVRLVPLPLPLISGAVVVRVPALRLRFWLSNAAITAVQCWAGVVLLFSGPGMGFTQSVGLGLLLLGTMTAVLSPRSTGSRAWILWRMPFDRDGAGLREIGFEPAGVAASRALLAGRLDEADVCVSELVDQDAVPALLLRAAVVLGLGDYRKAALLAVRGLGRSNSPAQRAMLAGIHSRAAAYELEAGTLAPEVARPAMEYAFDVIRAEFPQLLRFGDLAATAALLQGRAPEALRLARKATKRYTDVQTTAFGLCTLAAAQAVTGDRRGAAATLDGARAAMPLLARIAVIEQRIAELDRSPARP